MTRACHARPGASLVVLSTRFIAILFLLYAPLLLVKAALPYYIDLNGKSFSLRVQLAVYSQRPSASGGGKAPAKECSIDEFHSYGQRRTRIDYQFTEASRTPLDTSTRKRSIFASDAQVFDVDHELATCKRMTHDQLDGLFSLDFLQASLDATEYLVGVARLLLYVNEHADKFAQLDAGASYVYHKRRSDAEDTRVQVDYQRGEGDAATGTALPLGVPTRIVVERPNSLLVFRFRQVTLLSQYTYSDSGVSSAQRGFTGSGVTGGVQFDIFAITRAMGCSADSQDFDYHESLERKDPYRFSFDARAQWLAGTKSATPIVLTVGYEPDIQTLRVDRSVQDRVSRTLVSYRHDRAYNIMERRAGSDRFFDEILRVRPGDDFSCAVSKVGLGNPKFTGLATGNSHSLGAMLLGATKLTYLGFARVRGIDAFAFEAHDGQVPVWLEQPTVYQAMTRTQNASELVWRTGAPALEPSAFKLTSVFYFARMDSSKWDPTSHKLLHVELLKMSAANSSTLLTEANIDIHDFSWHLRALAPNGMRAEDFYSLDDACLARSAGNNHFARVDLELRGTEVATQAPDWLLSPVKRNLALVKALHEQLLVPPTLLYDIESRYQVPQTAQKPGVIRFRAQLAERYEAPVTLMYAGRATFRKFMDFVGFPVFEFQDCYLAAAHKHANTLFAYENTKSMCHIHSAPTIDGTTMAEAEKHFILGAYELEIYMVLHQPNRKLAHDDYITRLDGMDARLVSTTSISLVDPGATTTLAQKNASSSERAYFGLSNFRVDHLDERTAYDVDEDHLDDANKFPGLGLLPEDGQNKLVGPKWAPDEDPETHQLTAGHQVAMSFEQCRQACLLDVECQSFSTCIVDGQVECVLSSVDLKSSKLVLELMRLQEKKSGLSEIFTIRIGGSEESEATGDAGGWIHIMKRPTCELHNKLYGDLFRAAAGLRKVSIQKHLLVPVVNSEQCAELCFRKTHAAMRSEGARLQARRFEIEHWTVSAHDGGATYCEAYSYLAQRLVDALNLTKIATEQPQITDKAASETTRGYCALQERTIHGKNSAQQNGENSTNQVAVELRQFMLDFSILYEPSYGVSLAETIKSGAQASAYKRLVLHDDFSAEHVEVARAFDEHGGNTGFMWRAESAAVCARRCFTQLTPLWPACRSFDLLEIYNKITARRRTVCAFNTVTLARLRALGESESIRRNNEQTRYVADDGEQAHIWHYEPRQGLVATALEDIYQIERLENASLLARLRESASTLRLGFVSLFLTAVIVIAVGAAAGTHLGPHRAPDDREILVSSSAVVHVLDVALSATNENENL